MAVRSLAEVLMFRFFTISHLKFRRRKSFWKEVKRAPNHQTEMNLVVNFISKAELTDKLEHLQDENLSISHKNEVMQILWLVSSLINCAREVGANVHIYCKP